MKSLKDAAIENLKDLMFNFSLEKMPQKTRKLIFSYMRTVAINAFRLGYQSDKDEMTEFEFIKSVCDLNSDHKVINSMNELLSYIDERDITKGEKDGKKSNLQRFI